MLEVQNLGFAYKNKQSKLKDQNTDTLQNLNFSIEEGEIFGFLGPSGAGKSTTQKILIGILKDYQGELRLMGKTPVEHGRQLYEHIGVAFEFPNLYLRFTAEENLSYFSSFYTESCLSIPDLLSMVGLQDESRKKVENYSKGMKMRLNFCRALLPDPKILFLDEPTSGLDPSNAQNIKKIILDQKKQGKTIFLTTHNMSVAEDLCDRVAFLVDGKIVLIDNPRDLRVKHSKRTVRVEYQKNNSTVSEEFFLDSLAEDQAFQKLLKEQPLDRIYSIEPSLEEIFIQITGRQLI
jgi:fluoroquinolone transport system ATP-binding protein